MANGPRRGMYLTAGDTQSARTVSCPLYDPPPDSNTQLGVPNIEYDPQGGAFRKDVTNGAGANAPSENVGFYFGGLFNLNGTKFDYFAPPTDLWSSLIKVTTVDQGHADWAVYNVTSNIPWRAEGALVWVPASSQGLLIAIGGVVKPADLNYYIPSDNATKSMKFLKEFPVYDIGSNEWSLQTLNDGSPFPDDPLAQFCTVVASSADGSHHEIYVYGGWDSNGGKPQGEVWILTVPSFTWIRADSPGRAGDPRQGHVCFSPYADQMIVVGGTGASGGLPNTNNTVDVYNLNELNWTGTYDPTVYQDYKPHQTVLDVISATPTASNLASDVAGWFSTKYNMDRIKFYGPYKSVNETTPPPPTHTTTGTPTPTPRPHRDWVVPVAASVGTVGGLALVGLLIFFCYHKQIAERRRQSKEPTEANNRKSWIVPWLWSSSSAAGGNDVGSDTITEVENPSSPPPMAMANPLELEGEYVAQSDADASTRRERWSSSTPVRSPRVEYAGPVEGPDTAVHEVHGSSRITHPDDINYDFRNMAMYPPSFVSGGHSTTAPSGSISGPNDSNTPALTHSTSAGAPGSPNAFPTILEGDAFGGEPSSAFGRAVSPINARHERPIHRRNPSSVSSEGISPPLADLDQSSALPGRPRVTSRSVSGEEGEITPDGQASHTV
jgi:Kelch motif